MTFKTKNSHLQPLYQERTNEGQGGLNSHLQPLYQERTNEGQGRGYQSELSLHIHIIMSRLGFMIELCFTKPFTMIGRSERA